MGEKKKYNHFWRIKPERGRNWTSRDYVKYTHTFKEIPKSADAGLIATLAKGAIKKGGVGTKAATGTGCNYAIFMNLFKKTQHKKRGTRTRTRTLRRTSKRRVL